MKAEQLFLIFGVIFSISLIKAETTFYDNTEELFIFPISSDPSVSPDSSGSVSSAGSGSSGGSSSTSAGDSGGEIPAGDRISKPRNFPKLPNIPFDAEALYYTVLVLFSFLVLIVIRTILKLNSAYR